MQFQDVVSTLNAYWARQGCVVQYPYEIEKGASTMNPATFLRVLGPEPWNVANVDPCRRPTDGRYGDNPNRLQHYFQYQVIMKPSPGNIQDLYLDSLRALGVKPQDHDIRFVEDNWESPTLGAWGVGWEVWLDGMEVTQFTYFQQAGGLEIKPVAVEITYGCERLAMYLQNREQVYDLSWNETLTYGDIYLQNEQEQSTYNFEVSSAQRLYQLFDIYRLEAEACLAFEKETATGEKVAGLVLPAYDYVLKCSHTFNLLDARGAISRDERTQMILRIRRLAEQVAKRYVAQRQAMGYPLLRHPAATAMATAAH